MAIQRGDLAPEFCLDGSPSARYCLGDYKGQTVVLVFYPADNSPVCTNQLNSYTAHIGDFEGVNARVLAISPQDVASHDAFADANGGFAFPLLSDTDKEVGRMYGIVGPLGFYRRSVVVVNPSGRVAYAHRSIAGVTFKATDEILRAIEQPADHDGHNHDHHHLSDHHHHSDHHHSDHHHSDHHHSDHHHSDHHHSDQHGESR